MPRLLRTKARHSPEFGVKAFRGQRPEVVLALLALRDSSTTDVQSVEVHLIYGLLVRRDVAN